MGNVPSGAETAKQYFTWISVSVGDLHISYIVNVSLKELQKHNHKKRIIYEEKLAA